MLFKENEFRIAKPTYQEAFPKVERMPMWMVKCFIHPKTSAFYTVYEGRSMLDWCTVFIGKICCIFSILQLIRTCVGKDTVDEFCRKFAAATLDIGLFFAQKKWISPIPIMNSGAVGCNSMKEMVFRHLVRS